MGFIDQQCRAGILGDRMTCRRYAATHVRSFQFACGSLGIVSVYIKVLKAFLENIEYCDDLTLASTTNT